MYYIVYSVLDGYLCCFCAGLFHSAAVDIYIHGFLWTYVFIHLGIPKSRITGPHSTLHFNFLKHGHCASQSSSAILDAPHQWVPIFP